MLNYQMIEEKERQCQVCCMPYQADNFYSLSDCSHYFCHECCVNHIKAKLLEYTEIRCIQAKCQKTLKTNSKLYGILPEELKTKYMKYQTSIKIQRDKSLRPCMKSDCIGYIKIIQGKQQKQKRSKSFKKLNPQQQVLQCSHCHSEHCSTCFQLTHPGKACETNTEDKKNEETMMRNLSYRRCPKCQIWVQKKGGCQYLTCKCGCEFCYLCAVEFHMDPCRKKNLQGVFYDQQMRKTLKTVKLSSPLSILSKILLPFKLILILVWLIFLTIFSGIMLIFFVLGVSLPLICLIAPGFLVVVYPETGLSECLVIFFRILTILLYPVVGVLVMVIALLILITYPLMRLVYPTRLYDALDQKCTQMGVMYLKTFRYVLVL